MKKYVLAGGSGFLGSALRTRWAEQGHQVTRLVRREPVSLAEVRWDPDRGELDPQALADADVVINLCGAGVADRPWTKARRRLLTSSRVNPTRTLTEALLVRAAAGHRPVLIQGSAVGWYGVEFTAKPRVEGDPAADDFLARLVAEWEAAAQPVIDAGLRVALLRTSLVLDRTGGLLQLMKLPFSCGLGAQFGDGRQHFPIISLEDWLDAVDWIIEQPEAAGPYNLATPKPVTNGEFTKVLAKALRRPCFLKAPAPLLRLALGDLAEQLLGDQHLIPDRLVRSGFRFSAPDADAVIAEALSRRSE